MAQPPASSVGLCASAFRHLFAARKLTPWGAAGPGGPGGSQAAAGQAVFPGGAERRKGNARSVLRGRLLAWLSPVRTALLGRQGQESRSQGPGCCPMRELIPPPHPALLCGRGSWTCWEVSGNQEGYRPWEHHPPPIPHPPETGSHCPQLTSGPTALGSVYEASGGKAGGSAQC